MVALGGSADMVALIQTSLALPIVLFSLTAGAMADAFGRRRMVLVSQTCLLIVSVALALFAYLDILTPSLLLVFTFLIGSGKALNNPGWQTKVNELVPREQLSSAIALNSIGFNLARSVGPAIGGLIVATVGAFAAFVVNAVANVGVILTARRWPDAEARHSLPPERLGSAIIVGVRYMAMSPHLMRVLLRAAFFNFSAISIMALMPLVARDIIGGGPQVYGFVLGAFGVGAICGALIGVRMRSALSLEWTVRSSFLAFSLGMLAVSFSSSIIVVMLATAVTGAGWMMAQTTFNTIVQSSSPRWVVSRCHALFQTVTFGFNGLGSFIWGLVAVNSDVSNALFISSIAVFVSGMMGMVWKIVPIDITGMSEQSTWKGPEIEIDMLPVSGPVQARITYAIAEADITLFLELMLERRRYRIRDGASAWTLSRDVERKEIWYETYKTPTWAEMQRSHHRRTETSADIASNLKKLHQGGRKPSVHYELIRRPQHADPIIKHSDHSMGY